MAQLIRGIRKWDFVALVLNSVVGAGIFGLPSRVFALAGTYSLLAYVACAVPIFLILLCFAEVSSRFNATGGPYLYARSAFGPVVGFEVGWLTWLARATAFAALCNLFVDYLAYFLPLAETGLYRNLVICLVVSVLTAINVAGVRLASRIGNLVTIGKMVPLVLLVAIGIFWIDFENYTSISPPDYSAFSMSVLLLVYAFSGFETAVIPAGEGLDPARHMPFALLVGTAIAGVLYVAIQAVCIGTVPDLATSQRPLADAGSYVLGRTGAVIITLGALISVTGTMNSIMLAVPRVLFGMAEQGQLPAVFAGTHRRFHTPHVAIFFSAVAVLGLTLWGTFITAAVLSTIIRLATYAVTCAALPILRRTSGQQAVFAAPGGWVVSTTALVLIGWLLSSSSWVEVRQALVAGSIGLVLFAAAATRHRQPQEVSCLTS